MGGIENFKKWRYSGNGGILWKLGITTFCPLFIMINSFLFLQTIRKSHQANSRSHLLTDPNKPIHHTRRKILIKREKSRNRKCRCKLISLDFCFIFSLLQAFFQILQLTFLLTFYRLACQFGQFWRIMRRKLKFHSENFPLIKYDD